jgi:glutamate-1-semialdehyde aminotransferase
MHKVTSEELFQRALKVTPGGVHSPVRSFKGLDRAPVFFKQAEGAFLTSVEDKKYIDFCQFQRVNFSRTESPSRIHHAVNFFSNLWVTVT